MVHVIFRTKAGDSIHRGTVDGTMDSVHTDFVQNGGVFIKSGNIKIFIPKIQVEALVDTSAVEDQQETVELFQLFFK